MYLTGIAQPTIIAAAYFSAMNLSVFTQQKNAYIISLVKTSPIKCA